MLDFSSLLSGLADEVKRKPNKKPEQLPLPSEVAIGDAIKGAQQFRGVSGKYYPGNSFAPVAEESINANVLPPEPSQGAPMTENPLGLGEQQLSATQQGIVDEPANKDNIYGLPLADASIQGEQLVAPRADRTPRKLSLDEDIAQKTQAVNDAQNAEIKPQSWWKDFGAKLVQGADAFFNGNRAPIVGWGRLKHDQAVQAANAKLNPLIAQKKQEQEFQYKDAQIGKFKSDQENQIRDDNDRFLQSIRKRKYYDPAKASVAEKTRLASLGLKPEDLGSWDDRDPKTLKWGDSVWQYDADKKAWVESGIAKDPTLKPEVYEVEETDADGKVIKDANGNPVTRKFVTTSKGAAALKEYANSRKASLRLGQDRLGETRRSNKVREGIAQQQFDFAKTKWNDTMRLRAEAMTRRDAAQASGDIEAAKKAELDYQKFEEQLKNWRVNWKAKIGTGGFTEEDYNELIGEQ